jgi:UPF0716 family protein affecting phage T7 exclusion
MNQPFRYRRFSGNNPLANALVVIAGILVIALSIALGFFVFVTIGGLMLVMAAVVGVRAWWLRKRFGAPDDSGRDRPHRSGTSQQHHIIEGEFEEVDSKNKNRSGR